jgi:putative DNA primase/helicase
LPDALAPWVDDIANRLQCPPDYVAVTALTALGAVIGRRIGIRPQAKTDWIEIPNIWGGFIGRPGMLKSPAMGAALKPIHHLEAEAAKENELAREAYKAGLQMFKLKRDVAGALPKANGRKTGT